MTVGSMQYLPPAGQQKGFPQSGADKYHGAIAQGYDAKREGAAKWTVEQRIIEDMLSDLPPASWILDAPCGTGRFLDYAIRNGLIYRGLDLSKDMIAQAAAKIGNQCAVFTMKTPDGREGQTPQVSFTEGSVLTSGIPDRAVDAVLNIRITRWLSSDECQQMFREMQRISRDRIIMTARIQHDRHPEHSRPYALFESVMSDEWELVRSECGASGPADAPVEDPQYRIFQWKRKQAVSTQPKTDNAWIMDPYEA